MFDVHNAHEEKEPLPDLVRRYMPYIKHVHVNEMDGSYPGAGDFDSEELRLRGYANMTFLDSVAVSVGVEHKKVESQLPARTDRITTTSIPVAARYFHSSGIFAGLGGTWIDQDSREQAEVATQIAADRDRGRPGSCAAGSRLHGDRRHS